MMVQTRMLVTVVLAINTVSAEGLCKGYGTPATVHWRSVHRCFYARNAFVDGDVGDIYQRAAGEHGEDAVGFQCAEFIVVTACGSVRYRWCVSSTSGEKSPCKSSRVDAKEETKRVIHS